MQVIYFFCLFRKLASDLRIVKFSQNPFTLIKNLFKSSFDFLLFIFRKFARYYYAFYSIPNDMLLSFYAGIMQ